jgi:uncharacterized protein (TIGR04551 family)
MTRWLTPLACVGFLMILPDGAAAQMGRMPGSGGRMGRGGDNKPDKPRVATQGKEPVVKKKPKRAQTWGLKKPMQFFKLEGYFRVRSDAFHKLHLGHSVIGTLKPPALQPLQYYDTGADPICPAGSNAKVCDKNWLRSTNMRLHLEPTLNVHSRVRIKMTLDIFDNMVLGSTPEGQRLDAGRPTQSPMNAFASTAEVPQAGRNSMYDAILVKHVWGEVDLPFGRLMFGRMPSHWGLGILANSGTCSGYRKWTVNHRGDPMRCMDSDYGDIADRIMFATKIPIVNLLVGFSWDFQSSGLTTLNLQGEQVQLSSGQPMDLTPADNVNQWVGIIGRIDDPLKVKQRLARGEVVFNYGSYWVFRKQHLDYEENSSALANEGALAGNLVVRNAFAMIPDIWMRLNWKKLSVEMEAVMIYGKIKGMTDFGLEKELNILQFGGVFKSSYRFLNDSLVIGLEVGAASGDDELEAFDRRLNYRGVKSFPEDPSRFSTNSMFRFDPNYRVDLIFFREIMGTVYNAGYVKPHVTYHILNELSARLDIIYAFAMEPVATPGNNPHYGVEFDLDVEYRLPESGFFVGLAYGVFIPLGALHWPSGIYDPGNTEEYLSKAKVAMTLQLRAAIKF